MLQHCEKYSNAIVTTATLSVEEFQRMMQERKGGVFGLRFYRVNIDNSYTWIQNG